MSPIYSPYPVVLIVVIDVREDVKIIFLTDSPPSCPQLWIILIEKNPLEAGRNNLFP